MLKRVLSMRPPTYNTKSSYDSIQLSTNSTHHKLVTIPGDYSVLHNTQFI